MITIIDFEIKYLSVKSTLSKSIDVFLQVSNTEEVIFDLIYDDKLRVSGPFTASPAYLKYEGVLYNSISVVENKKDWIEYIKSLAKREELSYAIVYDDGVLIDDVLVKYDDVKAFQVIDD